MNDRPAVAAESHLTLHYRISLAQDGVEVISTFGGRPATLQLGLGQLVEPLERCLLGLREGAQASFELAPEQAFGPRNPQLVRRISRAELDAHSDPDSALQPGDVVEFPAPEGGRFSGVLKQLDAHSATFDFNHPLAGKPIRFDVQILGVL
ncbi:MAG TPA: FKBP-type peptidyl-prolyl cis-trans isomerase [Burkholderiaceae bacterium]|nr:FKBP-type peptidyl-prolyl cis-trans isomerase [Burkholderiaceae bacterium]